MATAEQGTATSPIDRFRRDLDALVPAGTPIGLAVSGGPDSLALLLLAVEARPLGVEAATVDHVLRPESRAEAESRGRALRAAWSSAQDFDCEMGGEARKRHPGTRSADALSPAWRLGRERGLTSLVTAHHSDDQAETFLMRLARGSGVQASRACGA